MVFIEWQMEYKKSLRSNRSWRTNMEKKPLRSTFRCSLPSA